MTDLHLPAYEHKLKYENNSPYIFDDLRKKWVACTPEEWVRQHMVHYLILHKKYPSGLMAVEYQLNINNRIKRSDIVCFNHEKTPVLLVECKAPSVPVSQKTFDQIIQYNFHFRVKYLLVTNGLQHYCCYANFEANQVSYLKSIPAFDELHS